MAHRVCIDASLCVGCGACAADCPAANIEMIPKEGAAESKRQTARVWNPEECLFCGHCEAICPAEAVTLTGFAESPEDVPDGPVRLDPDVLLQAIKTRRSIRHFTAEAIPKDVIDQILEAGRLTQTAKNSQRQSYVVLQERLGEAEKIAVTALRQLLGADEEGGGTDALGRAKIGDDFMFFGAPLAIVVLSPSKTDGCLAAENMALMAEACGLGVLFSGFFTDVANEVPALREMFGIDDTRQAVATLVLGQPDIRYRRTVRREAAKVTWL